MGVLTRAVGLALALNSAAAFGQTRWVGSWGADPTMSGQALDGLTVRATMRLSLGGDALRLRLSNASDRPLVIGDARVARHGPLAVGPTAITFGGGRSVTIAAGREAVSDPALLSLTSLGMVDVSLFVVHGRATVHPKGLATALLARGDVTGAAVLAGAKSSSARLFVTEIDVAHMGADTVVAFGDSITDGYGSRPDHDHRWPDQLATRLAAARSSLGVVDAGIAGNRILTQSEPRYGASALSRFDRDALSVPNVRTVILLEGINDIGGAHAGADAIIAGMRALVARAHARGVRVIGGTLTPFAGSLLPGYYSASGERVREVVNDWIRSGGIFDGVIDFDASVRDPADPTRLSARYDCGDHLHLNDGGYARMADAVDLRSLAGDARPR